MSLRPMLYAVDVAPLIALRNHAPDAIVVGRVVDRWASLAGEEGKDIRASRKRLAALSSPVMRLRAETEIQVHLIYLLAEEFGLLKPDHLIADGDWKQDAWQDYLDTVKHELPNRTREILSQLITGRRCVFGRRIRSSWAYYGVINRADIGNIAKDLAAAGENHPALLKIIDGFHGELQSWFETIKAKGTDAFLFAE